MTKLRVREYEPEDFLNIELMEYEKMYREGQPLEKWAQIHKLAGPAFTVTTPDGRIVFLCGVHDLWSGAGEAWATYSVLALAYPHSWAVQKHLFETGGRHYFRLQAVVDPRFPEALRLTRHLGFKREGLMRRYGPHGEDHVMCAAVREG